MFGFISYKILMLNLYSLFKKCMTGRKDSSKVHSPEHVLLAMKKIEKVSELSDIAERYDGSRYVCL